MSNIFYFSDCSFMDLNYGDFVQRLQLYDFVQQGSKFYAVSGGTYTIVSRNCGDCTAFESNIKPEFWED